MNKKILVGVAWPYVNGDIHVGHLAGYLIPADIVARYYRLRGDDVLMVSGSDCHGTPITVEADKQGKTPQEIVDQYHPKDVELFKQYGISFNLYTKTTTENHKQVVHGVFLDLLNNGFIVKDVMKQYYSEEDRQFLPDRYVEGTCPHCNAHDQRSDQCESCGRWLEDGELIDPKSKLTGAIVTLKDTEHYFLDLEKLAPELEKYVESRQGKWRSWVYKETMGWLKEGLRKRAITRDMDWAIELPVDELIKLPAAKQLTDYTGKHIYVWFEAVVGYLSAPQEWVELSAENDGIIFSKSAGQSNNWQDWWVGNDDSKVMYNFMGQDNLVFHTLMWPGQLIGTQRDYKLPDYVVVNKFMNYEGKKFSKSRNWTIDSKKIADKYGADLVRYYIAANLPENKEANFTWEGFVDQINNELVANLGNLVNRTLKFLESKFDGEIAVDNFEMDQEPQTAVNAAWEQVGEHITQGDLVEALNGILALAKQGNQYFDQQQVWQVIKNDEEKARTIMLNLLNLLSALNTMLLPYLPNSMHKMAAMMGIGNDELGVGEDAWKLTVRTGFKLTTTVEPLFPKLDKETVLSEKEN